MNPGQPGKIITYFYQKNKIYIINIFFIEKNNLTLENLKQLEDSQSIAEDSLASSTNASKSKSEKKEGSVIEQ